MKLSGVRPFVCLSACLSIRPTVQPPHATAAGFLLWALWAGDIDRLLHSQQSTAATMQHGTARSQQMRAVLHCQLV